MEEELEYELGIEGYPVVDVVPRFETIQFLVEKEDGSTFNDMDVDYVRWVAEKYCAVKSVSLDYRDKDKVATITCSL